jgi:tetratricopeptide (TPR) repeat protein
MDCKKLKLNKIYHFLIIVISSLFISCFSQKEVTNLPNVKTNYTENEILEYKYYFFKGLELKKKKDYPNSVQCFFRCLAIDSIDYPSLRNIAIIHKDINSYAGMKTYADKAIEAAKVKNIPVTEMTNLVIDYYKSKNDDNKVIELYKELLETYPQDYNVKQNYINFLTKIYQTDQALKLVKEIENAKGQNSYTYKVRFRNFLNQNKFIEANQILEKLIGSYPDSINFRLLKADVFIAKGKINEAIEVYRKQADTYSNLNIQILTAKKFESIKDSLGAFKQYSQIVNSKLIDKKTKLNSINSSIFRLNLKTDDETYAFKLAKQYLDQYKDDYDFRFLYKEVLYRNKKYSEYIEQLKILISLDSSNTQFYRELVSASAQVGDIDGMYKYSSKAYEMDPHNPYTIWIYGQSYMRDENYEKAVEIFQNGLNFCLSNSDVLFRIYSNLGDCYFNIKDYDKMIKYCEEAVKLDSNNALLLNNYSYYLSIIGKDLEKAKKYSRKAVTLEPNNPIYLDTFAWVCFKMKDYEDALAVIERAVSLHKEEAKEGETLNAEIFEHHADILYMLGRKDEARKLWKEAKQYEGYSDKLDAKIKKGEYID